LGGSEKQIELAENIQFIWQIGKLYESDFGHSQTAKLPNVQAMTFIDRMDMAYRAADLVICRAGALTISELCLLRKASILVPSPNVAEDHQTMNAKALVNQGAALYIPDVEAENELMTQTMMLVHDTPQLSAIESKIGALGKPGATRNIVNEIFRIADKP
ncbi:MAG: UDP-N-acetylglucosamine--N-acetylmuramyl-(pentapeptide) pyrophosphoryl-undecaprenol N-acetylglucosamine transferase, partial [Saprospiraceae bacterium]|nr:UDP-N-acetylglucosamine--N-acetylmuramyl-(pentapeptide) pyrophosphoryl-undecaprenol N-acetylglucosamine transferase [Saprospiraceae bacterium]